MWFTAAAQPQGSVARPVSLFLDVSHKAPLTPSDLLLIYQISAPRHDSCLRKVGHIDYYYIYILYLLKPQDL